MDPSTLPGDADALRTMLLEVAALKDNLEAELAGQQTEIENLRGQIRLLLHKRFGPSSEKSSANQLQLFNEAEDLVEKEESAEAEETVLVQAHTRVRKGRRPLPTSLPRVVVLHDLSEEEKICPRDGCGMERIGEETHEQLSVIPSRMQVIRHVRPKYACPRCEEGVRISPPPPQVIPKSMASAGLLAYIATSKYVDALPLYRQSKIFERWGVDLSRTVMANWMIMTGTAVQPIINLLRDELIEDAIIQCDETRCQVLKEPGRPAQRQSYIWAQRGGSEQRPVILFDYDSSRGGEVPQRLLEGFSGYLQTDGYDGYNAVCKDNDKIVRVGCWAHSRRRFDEAVKAQKKAKGGEGSRKLSKAHKGLWFVKELYKIEKEIRGKPPGERKEVREAQARPILNELRKWLDVSRDQVPPKSLTGRALGYLHDQWDHLIRYLDDGRLEMDNNRIENAIRPFVVGRKNWMFSDTVKGAEASANIYSVIETAKANGLDPYRYLLHLLTELPKAKRVEDFEKLLPTRCTEAEIGETIRRDPAFG
jgi:transposase